MKTAFSILLRTGAYSGIPKKKSVFQYRLSFPTRIAYSSKQLRAYTRKIFFKSGGVLESDIIVRAKFRSRQDGAIEYPLV